MIQRITPGMGGMPWLDRFGGLSPEGRQILGEAMRPQVTAQDREAMRSARQRVLNLIAADKLDVAAVRRAQAAERELAVRQHERQQAAMLSAYQKLSAADRKAFVAGMQDQEERMLKHMERARQHMQDMEKRMRERMKEREGAAFIEPAPIIYPLPVVAGR
jgi:TRAP-type C4-dicarboxylate transport system substrate-binding protein